MTMRPINRPMPPERLGSRTRKIGTLQHFRWLRNIVIATLVLNALDAMFTIVWISLGLATEANPFMTVVHEDPALFVTVKFLLVALGSLLLWKHRKRRAAVVGLFGCFMLYYLVVLYHLQALDLHLLQRITS